MRILLGVGWIGSALLRLASSWDLLWCLGYASHSRAYRVLNIETIQIVETCEVTFDKTQPRTQLVFECVGDDELGEEIFQEEEHDHGDDEWR
jgi:hypothetical protein